MKINNFNSSEKILRYHNKIDYFFNAHKTLIVTELDLTNKCNHRCPGCCGNNENNAELTKEQVENVVENLKNMDNKGVILSGGGEPTCSPYFEYAIKLLKKAGQNIGLNSHGMNLKEHLNEVIAENLEYFRISLDAGSPEMYKKIHGMKPYHFEKTLQNIENFSKTKQRLGSKISFGVGFLTSSITEGDMESFVKLVKDRGVDFAQFRPFTGDTLDIIPKLESLREKYEDSNFKIVASYQKYNEMAGLKESKDRGYNKCHGMFFSTVISADFKVWACLHFRQSQKHFLGDLREQSLEEIWRGARIKEVYNAIDCSKCPILCRNDSFNRTLDKLSLDITNSEFL
ncbi:radical SAM protein [Helicobacter muridarum]|uniref:Molybdenum cofactor biosynthesis protein A n=1 Tax=Helicobacter muridarum TaxID=216 RepID=A0A377PSW8_9HELI|nr:radical SAM protein [Helicobacter muridarum]TLE01084.1 radical SAM protein [Helicobacter muridarum]STQ85946.1 molybdenum cofactor biosynthesis protein A [Helicobacter muridarum]